MRAEVVQEAALVGVEAMPRDAGPPKDVEVKRKFKVDGCSEAAPSHEVANPTVRRPKASVEVDHKPGLGPEGEPGELHNGPVKPEVWGGLGGTIALIKALASRAPLLPLPPER